MADDATAGNDTPRPGPADAVNLDTLRERVDELLDHALTGARLHTAEESADGPAPERLLEVTQAQIDALTQAHDDLAWALSILDDTH